MNTGASPKIIEEFDISLEDGSASAVVPPEPPAAPRLVLQVPREYTWRVKTCSDTPGTTIEFYRRGGLS